jgi:PBP1b-binding outer membrane lipoprotein LpoB
MEGDAAAVRKCGSSRVVIQYYIGSTSRWINSAVLELTGMTLQTGLGMWKTKAAAGYLNNLF